MRKPRECFEALAALRDTLNEHIPMPSLEAELLLYGPEFGHTCECIAEAVIAEVTRLRRVADSNSSEATHLPRFQPSP